MTTFDFTGKRVLVTGGTRGIGRGIVEAFLEAGARVAVNGSTAETTAKAIQELKAGDRVVAAPGSVATVAGCRALVEAAVKGLGGLDALVNNAGVGGGATVEKASEENWDRIVDSNLKGVFFVTKFALPALKAAKGAIVNIASVNGLIGIPGGSIYAASKAGVISLTKSCALEFGPDVRVNAICPGGIDTDMLRNLAVRIAGNVEAGYKVIAEDCKAQKRIAHVSEIAGPALYLCSDIASFVTGSIHVVDGGETID
jgi:NAD(P)-dependent dehydrogenase (short-subunit alcohol dehydrogenase family)